MKNVVPAFAAFDSSIDQLKHQMFVARVWWLAVRRQQPLK
jgi:hypothetical protein